VEHARDSRPLRSLPANRLRRGRKDPQSLSFRLCGEPGDTFAEGERLVAVEPKTLCDYGRPKRQNRRSIDDDGVRGVTPPAARYVSSRLIPASGRGVCPVEHLRQLLALLRGRPLTCDTVLVCPLICICVPRREHLVVVARDLGYRDRRCPAHAPATLADLIWSFHLPTRSLTCGNQRSMCRHPCPAQPDGRLVFSEVIKQDRVRKPVHSIHCQRGNQEPNGETLPPDEGAGAQRCACGVSVRV